MDDGMRYFLSAIKWVGLKRTSVPIQRDERREGKPSYPLRKLVSLAVNVMLGFSDKPLRLAVTYGIILSVLAMAFAAYTLYRYFVGGITVSGWASLSISFWFLTGNVILVLGVVGLYIGQIFEKVKMRPPYIIAEMTDE